MSHLDPPPTRPRAGTTSGAPHAISLKVLRLSRPTLATHTPLPLTAFANGLDIPSTASLAHPSADPTSTFPLTPLLTLPSSFGAAYVGETFACTLCANNEQTDTSPQPRTSVRGVRIAAELQTPAHGSDGIPLELEGGRGTEEAEEEENEEETGKEAGAVGVDEGKDEFPVGATLQRTLRYALTDEGPHVLAVTVTYSETSFDPVSGAAMGNRARTFRKLYQFVAQPLVAVRSKVTERKRRGKDAGREWVLEAQLENVGETSVVVGKVALIEKEGIRTRPVNADAVVVLKPQDVEQVMFVAEEVEKVEDITAKVSLAQVHIEWRSAMGEQGSLTTGWLASRGR